MSISTHKRLTIALGLACIGLLLLAGRLFWSEASLTIRLALADDQTKIFEEMRTSALQGNPSEAAGLLRYVVRYYPSGSKQESGSRLNRMVERARQSAVRDIIAYLRIKTGQDLGDSPQAWIEKFAPE